MWHWEVSVKRWISTDWYLVTLRSVDGWDEQWKARMNINARFQSTVDVPGLEKYDEVLDVSVVWVAK